MENNTEKTIKELQNDIGAMLFLFSMQEEVNDIALVTEYMAHITNPTVTELTTYSKALKRFHRDLKPIIKKIKGEYENGRKGKFGVTGYKLLKGQWSFGFAITHDEYETYLYINFIKWNVAIGIIDMG